MTVTKPFVLSRMLTAILSHLRDRLGSGHDHQADAEGEIIEVRIQSQVSTTEVTQASVPGEHACFCLRAPCPTCLLMSEEVFPHPHPRHITTTTKYNRKPSSGLFTSAFVGFLGLSEELQFVNSDRHVGMSNLKTGLFL